MPKWEDIDVPAGNFIGWGKKGQEVTVRVLAFDPVGGTDYNDNTCPQMVGTLTDDCDNYQEKGTKKVRLDAGTTVTVTAGLANLKKGLLIADPKRDDLVRMLYEDDVDVAKGSVKVFKVQIARGAGVADSVKEEEI